MCFFVGTPTCIKPVISPPRLLHAWVHRGYVLQILYFQPLYEVLLGSMFSLASFCLSSWHQNSWSGKKSSGKIPPPPLPVHQSTTSPSSCSCCGWLIFSASDDAFTASNWGQTFHSRLPRSSAYAGNNLHGFTLCTQKSNFFRQLYPGRETKSCLLATLIAL